MAPKRIAQCQQKVVLVVTGQSADWSSTNQTRHSWELTSSNLKLLWSRLPARYKEIF